MEAQTHVVLTFATAIAGLIVTFVVAFVLGLWCGWMWRRRGAWPVRRPVRWRDDG